uniref:Uncharacterized protein n=1 Tax=Oryza nivara TaxID=4536 RepID=A0A0E0HTR5_ORYNI
MGIRVGRSAMDWGINGGLGRRRQRSCLPPPSHSDAGMYEYNGEVEEDYEEELRPASRARVDPPQPSQYP